MREKKLKILFMLLLGGNSRGQVSTFNIKITMARPLRLSFENAVYHITARGNRKENIFYSNRDRNVFLDKMNETFGKYSLICYAYCLMDNHYHLVVKTPQPNISEGMHYLNTSYSNWFKAKHAIVGVVFQGRYKSILVDEDNYAFVVTTYVHLNPIRAGKVRNLEEYKWNSYLDYIGKGKSIIERLDISFILSRFNNDLSNAQKRYIRYVYENIEMRNPLEDSHKGIALGSTVFIEDIERRIRSIGPKREIRETKFAEVFAAAEIINKIVEVFDIEKKEIFRKRRGNVLRQLALYLLKRFSDLSLKQIGELFNMDYAAVSLAAKRYEKRIKNDHYALSMRDMILKGLEKSLC